MSEPQHTTGRADADPQQVTVVLGGDLDVASAPGVRARLGAAMGGRRTTVVIDLAGVSFIDSSGLRELVAARARLLAGGRAVLVRSPSPAVLRLLRWTSGHEALGLVAEPLAAPAPLPAGALPSTALHDLPVSA